MTDNDPSTPTAPDLIPRRHFTHSTNPEFYKKRAEARAALAEKKTRDLEARLQRDQAKKEREIKDSEDDQNSDLKEKATSAEDDLYIKQLFQEELERSLDSEHRIAYLDQISGLEGTPPVPRDRLRMQLEEMPNHQAAARVSRFPAQTQTQTLQNDTYQGHSADADKGSDGVERASIKSLNGGSVETDPAVDMTHLFGDSEFEGFTVQDELRFTDPEDLKQKVSVNPSALYQGLQRLTKAGKAILGVENNRQEEIDELEQERANAVAASQGYQDENEKLRKDITELQQQVQQLQQQASPTGSDPDLQEKLAGAEADIDQFLQQAHQNAIEIAQLKKDLAAAKATTPAAPVRVSRFPGAHQPTSTAGIVTGTARNPIRLDQRASLAPTTRTGMTSSSVGFRLPDPDLFDGSKPETYQRWRRTALSKIQGNMSELGFEGIINYLQGRCKEGVAYDFFEYNRDGWQDEEEMWAQLDGHFDSKDQVLIAKQELITLEQKDLSWSDFYLKYQTLCMKARHAMDVDHIWLKLNKRYREAMVPYTDESFPSFCAQAKKFESRWYTSKNIAAAYTNDDKPKNSNSGKTNNRGGSNRSSNRDSGAVRVIPWRYKFEPEKDPAKKKALQARLQAENRCFGCREVGHRSGDSECIFNKSKGVYKYGNVDKETRLNAMSGDKEDEPKQLMIDNKPYNDDQGKE